MTKDQEFTAAEQRMRNDAKAEVADEAIERTEELNNGRAATSVAAVLQTMSMYQAFEHTAEIDHEFTELNAHKTADDYNHDMFFDSSEEIAELQRRAQVALNRSVGTRTENLARATLNTINKVAPDVLAELVSDSDYEGVVF